MDGGERAATRPHPTFRRSIVSIAALRIARTHCVGLLLALVGIPARASGLERHAGAGYDGFIIQFKPGSAPHADPRARQRLLDVPGRALGLSLNPVRRLGTGAELVRSNRKLGFREAEKLANRLRANPDVLYVELDRRLRRTMTPNDPLYNGHQWHYYEATGGIGLPVAWDIASGSGVVVAVLDTGITQHSDLNSNVVAGYDFISEAATARDGNGRDAVPTDEGDWQAADECGEGEEEAPSSWHGTHVAGTIAALTNNTKGVAGVAFNAKVMPLRVLGRCGGLSSDVVDAIVWAAGGAVTGVPANPNPVEVINMSLGGPASCGTDLQAAINLAVGAGVTVVVSAGNENVNAVAYEPANCANVIAVGATNRAGGKSSFSNYGSVLDVSAPGGEYVNGGEESYVASTWNAGTTTPGAEGYGLSQGTSMSAPHVSGVVALMQSLSASSPAIVESVIKAKARALPVACPQGCGAGILDAPASLSGVGSGTLVISDASASEGNAGTKLFTFTVSLSKAVAGTVSFDIATANGTASAGSDFVTLSLAGQTIPAGMTSKNFSVTVNGDTAIEGDETFLVNVTNVSGIAVARSQGVGTIVNDDATPLAHAVPVSPVGGAAGTHQYYSIVVPSGKTNLSVTTSGGAGDVDLYVRNGALPTLGLANATSLGNDNAESVSIDDPVADTWYVLVYSYAASSGATLVATYAPAPPPTISISDAATSEGHGGSKLVNFTVSLSATSGSPVGFDVASENGTAVAGSDYAAVALAGQSIPAGQTSANVSVTINGDTAVEGNETFAVELRNLSGAVAGKTRGQGRITNDDLASISIGDVTIAEGDSGTSTATFVVRLDKPMPSPVTYDIATSNGSASSGSDYVARALNGRFIDAGRSTQVFEVTINGDSTNEGGETFNVGLSNVGGALVGDATAVGIISNDDGPTATLSASRAGSAIATDGAGDADAEMPAECRSAEARAEFRRRGKSVRHCERTQRRR